MASWGDYALTGPFAGSDYIQSFLHPENAFKDAEKQSQKGWDEAKGYQEPFMQHGLDQYGRLNDATGKLLDPAALQDEWSKNYETSPWAKRQLSANVNQGQEAASSMGLSGSSAAIGNIQTGAGDIMAKDRQAYMDDLMKKYMQGIGLGNNLYNTGAQTAANLGGQAMTQGENMAGLKYGEAAAPGKLFGRGVGAAMNYAVPGSGNTFTGGGNNYNSGRPGYQQ